ncbi:MAG: arsenate reductase (glutaredoxin) [Acetobacteraceae bacterium]|nr:arsenate reductase (glutaredoxin) [Acetobacteraceae bacterium]
MMRATIYHNPQCGTSRNVLGILREAGVEATVIEYLKTPPARAELERLIKAIGKGVRGMLRKRGTPYEELGLDDPKWTDAQLIDFMLAHPILIERPIVVTDKQIMLARPSESVREILA